MMTVPPQILTLPLGTTVLVLWVAACSMPGWNSLLTINSTTRTRCLLVGPARTWHSSHYWVRVIRHSVGTVGRIKLGVVLLGIQTEPVVRPILRGNAHHIVHPWITPTERWGTHLLLTSCRTGPLYHPLLNWRQSQCLHLTHHPSGLPCHKCRPHHHPNWPQNQWWKMSPR